MKLTLKNLGEQVDTLNRYIIAVERQLAEERAKVKIYERVHSNITPLAIACERTSEAMAHIVSDIKTLKLSNKI